MGIYPNDMTAYIYKKPATEMFIVALLIIAKIWKHPKHPSRGLWRNKQTMEDSHIRDYNLAIKLNETMRGTLNVYG